MAEKAAAKRAREEAIARGETVDTPGPDQNEDLLFISETPLSAETKDDFLLTFQRQRKLILTARG